MQWGLSCAACVAALTVCQSASALGDVAPDGALLQRQPSGTQPITGPDGPEVADDRRAGSLLVYPEYDNREGTVSILSIANIDADPANEVDVEFVYIERDDCSEFNRVETLTANDALTLITNYHNPDQDQGYVYAFAREGSTPIVWNGLIGSLLVVDGLESFEYSVNAVSFRGVGDAGGAVQPNGTETDLDGDGIRDLDGAEYAQVPAEIQVPRFLGQGSEPEPTLGAENGSELILIALSGGAYFSTTVDFLIYNDNEEVFSSEYEFECWDKVALLDISGIFDNEFLADFTNHDPDEVVGAPGLESGWFRLDGALASSSVETILDPAVYCVLVERIGSYAVADLPFSTGGQPNGSLLPRHIRGDGDPTPVDGDNQ